MTNSTNKSRVFITVVLLFSFAVLAWPSYVSAETGKPLPPLPTGSSFEKQLDEVVAYYPVKAPEQPPLLRWDFSDKKVYSYDFLQRAAMMSLMDDGTGSGDRAEPAMTTELKGKVSLKAEGDHTARFVLEDLLMTTEINVPEDDGPKTMEFQAPPMVIQGVKEDGTMKLGASPQELLLKFFFPIPSTPLKVGESVSVPAAMPFNFGGSALHVTGKSVTKLADYVGLYGKTCAKLETTIDISTLDIPPELEGTCKCQVKGKSVFFFDIQGNHFVSGRVALIISMRADLPMPKISVSGEAEGVDLPETMRMSMDNDSFISLDYME